MNKLLESHVTFCSTSLLLPLLRVCRSAEERDLGEHGDTTQTPRPDAGATVQRYHGDGGWRAAEQPDDGGSDR